MSRFKEWFGGGRPAFAGLLAVLAFAGEPAAQPAPVATAPRFDPYGVATLSFRPGSTDELLLGTNAGSSGLQAHLVRVAADGRVLLLRTLPGTFVAVAYLDAGHVVTADDKGKLQSWPAGDGQANAPPTEFAALGETIAGIGISPRSRTIAVRLKAGPIRFFAPDGKPSGPALSVGRPGKGDDNCPPDNIETVVAFSTDERLLAFSGICGELRVAGRDGARLLRAEIPRPYVKRHAFSADGRTLLVTYTGQPGGGADFWPIAGGRLGTPRPFAGPIEHNDPADVAALPDNAGFVVLSTDRVRFLAADGRILRPDIALARPTRVAVSSDGTRIAVAAEEGLVLFDRTGKRLVDRPFAEFGSPVAMVAIAGGAAFAALSREGRMRFWRLDGSEARPPVDLWNNDQFTREFANQAPRILTSPTGRHFALHAPTGRFDIFDETWTPVGRPFRFPLTSNDGASRNATVLLDDRILRPLPDSTGFVVFDFDGRVLGRIPLVNPLDRRLEGAASASGILATYARDKRLRLWGADGRPLRERSADTDKVAGGMLDQSTDGRTVVRHDEPPYRAGMEVWRIGERDTSEVYGGVFVRLLPDGRIVRFTTGRLIVDAPDGKTRVEVAVDADSVHAVLADGSAALVGKNGVARLVKLSP